MQFLFQPLTWGFLLLAVPILIHLINLLRHRKQPWAAMDFLLESYRRNRRWVMLKQWLLLAARLLAMFLLVAMLAKWVSGTQWLSWIGGQTTQHYILLDDSYSMGEVDQNESAYQRGLQAVAGLIRSIAGSPGQHQITLVRWSRAALALANQDGDGRLDAAADLLGQSVSRDPDRLLDRVNATQPTAMQLSPEQPLELVAPMISRQAEQQHDVYLVTDLRRNEFGEPETLRNQLLPLAQSSTRLHLIDCAQDGGQNLSLVSVAPEQEVWAVGVPLMVRFQVRNRTAREVKNVVVRVRSVTYGEDSVTPRVDLPYSGDIVDLPPVVIEKISAGETVTRRVQVVFGVPGEHVVETSLADDVLDVDNRRWCTIPIQRSQRVLLVDGDPTQTSAFYFEKVIKPDARFSTGMDFDKVDASYLRDAAPDSLKQFDVIALLDVPRLDPQAIDKLEAYCREGGGILFTGGPQTNLKFVNEQLYRSGQGIYPLPLQSIDELPADQPTEEPMVMAQEHPILAPLLQLESSPFFMLQIRRQFRTDQQALADTTLDLVATGQNRQPLVVDKSFGAGRCVAVLTGLTSEWSNWAQDPTFVVFAIRSLGYLSSFRRPATSHPVGSPVRMSVTGQAVLPEAEVIVPARGDGMRIRLQQSVAVDDEQEVSRLNLAVDIGQTQRDVVDSLLRAGLFEAWMTNAQGDYVVNNLAHNVAAAEGDLERIAASDLEQKLRGVPVRIRAAKTIIGQGTNAPETVHSTLLMALLALLLLGEQVLAYSASYHTPTGAR